MYAHRTNEFVLYSLWSFFFFFVVIFRLKFNIRFIFYPDTRNISFMDRRMLISGAQPTNSAARKGILCGPLQVFKIKQNIKKIEVKYNFFCY